MTAVGAVGAVGAVDPVGAVGAMGAGVPAVEPEAPAVAPAAEPEAPATSVVPVVAPAWPDGAVPVEELEPPLGEFAPGSAGAD